MTSERAKSATPAQPRIPPKPSPEASSTNNRLPPKTSPKSPPNQARNTVHTPPIDSRRGYPYVKRIPSCEFYPYVNTMSMHSNNILILNFFKLSIKLLEKLFSFWLKIDQTAIINNHRSKIQVYIM